MSETGISELTRILPPERVTNDPTELTVYGYDGTWLERRPDVAVSVVSADEVAGVLRWANNTKFPSYRAARAVVWPAARCQYPAASC